MSHFTNKTKIFEKITDKYTRVSDRNMQDAIRDAGGSNRHVKW